MMSSPRKFAEKIALIQQKQAEGDAAFQTIIYEVEAAKQRADRVPSKSSKLDVPARKYEKSFDESIMTNGMTNSDNINQQTTNYAHQAVKMESSNGSDRLLQPPDNTPWRRTHSDSSLHYAMMPSVAAHYHATLNNDNEQVANYDMNDMKFDPSLYAHHSHLQQQQQQQHQHHLQVIDSHLRQQQFQQQHFDSNNNNNYINGCGGNGTYQSPINLPSHVPNSSTTNTHTLLAARSSGGSNNVLMLPAIQHPRGGSLPDLRTGGVFHQQPLSFSTTPPATISHHFILSPSSQKNNDDDLFASLGPQHQLPSRVGPLKQSPSMRRRHSPIGDGRPSSPRRQNSPSPDPNQATVYRVEPSSPQSQSSYSPQGSPHLLPSPGNDLGPFSPQLPPDGGGNNQQQPYFTLPTHFDQITLDNTFYAHQQQQQQQSPQQQHSSSSSSQQQHNHSPTSIPNATSSSNNVNGVNLNYLRPRTFYPPFIDDMTSCYSQSQTIVTVTTNATQKSPTIPNIILTDVDSSKLDLSKELANDFSNSFDSLIDPGDLQLDTDDFLLNSPDLSIDPIICDDTFRIER